jgi:hypothetical protein
VERTSNHRRGTNARNPQDKTAVQVNKVLLFNWVMCSYSLVRIF